jgi:hypothetical protein
MKEKNKIKNRIKEHLKGDAKMFLKEAKEDKDLIKKMKGSPSKDKKG